MKKALVLGAGGFIGHHLTRRLKRDGYFVKGVDLRYPDYSPSLADEFQVGDLRDKTFCDQIIDTRYQVVYQLAADMGGAGYIFTGLNDANIMSSSARINLNVLDRSVAMRPDIIFFASSACIYPAPASFDDGMYAEASAYPALPDSEYGWEKLFSERLYMAYARNHDLTVRIGRLHNVYGPESCWDGGREKAIAAICRKVISAPDHSSIQIWGDGLQTRSFLYIDECLDGIERLVGSSFGEPLNIGSSEMITVHALAQMIIDISGKYLQIEHIDGPVGVDIRTSNNKLITEKLGWAPHMALRAGIEETYKWIASRMSVQK